MGIYGIGVYLPDEVRTNAWWPESVVARWRVPTGEVTELGDPVHGMSEGQKRVLAAMAAQANDPFQGSVERRVLSADENPSDMEARAGRAALESAGVAPDDIDFLLTDGMVPDDLASPNACIVHHKLGLAARCMALSTEATCNAFAMQMQLAHGLIATGAYRRGLLIQSSAVRRLIPETARHAPWFGDGATGVVVGPVASGRGLLSGVHRTDGSLADGMVAGVPGRPWYEDGPIVWYPKNPATARSMLLSVADHARSAIGDALAQAALGPDQVDFYASHQATSWFRAVTQDHAGLAHARFVDTFARAGSLGAANIPLVLATALSEGHLRDGDIVATYSGGSGITWSSLVLCWGR